MGRDIKERRGCFSLVLIFRLGKYETCTIILEKNVFFVITGCILFLWESITGSKYYLNSIIDRTLGKATCKTCQKVISCRGRNTWVMRRHMEVQHGVKFPWAVGQKNKSKSINTAISTKVNNHGRTTECQSCGRSFSSLAQHLRQRCDDFTRFFLVYKY